MNAFLKGPGLNIQERFNLNKKILDGIEKVAWLKPTIEQPAEGIWQFGGVRLDPTALAFYIPG